MTEKHLSGQLKFDVEALLGVAPKYSQAAGWIDNALQDATRTLLGLGNFWGNDKPGVAFGKAYQAQQDLILKVVGMLSGDLDGISDGIKAMAKKYGITEEDIDARLRKLDAGDPEF